MTVNNERTLPEVMTDIVGNLQEISVLNFSWQELRLRSKSPK